jgi:hypothetical protein
MKVAEVGRSSLSCPATGSQSSHQQREPDGCLLVSIRPTARIDRRIPYLIRDAFVEVSSAHRYAQVIRFETGYNIWPSGPRWGRFLPRSSTGLAEFFDRKGVGVKVNHSNCFSGPASRSVMFVGYGIVILIFVSFIQNKKEENCLTVPEENREKSYYSPCFFSGNCSPMISLM